MQEKYNLLSRILHWLIALMIFALFGVGLYMTGLPDDDPGRGSIYGLHKATGFLLLWLVAFRIVWTALVTQAPPPPEALPDKDVKIQKAVIGILYLLMLVVPLSGFLMSTFAGFPVDFYGLFEVPLIFEKNKTLGGIFHEIHEYSPWVLMGFVLLHMLGAIKHRLADPNGPTDVLKRML